MPLLPKPVQFKVGRINPPPMFNPPRKVEVAVEPVKLKVSPVIVPPVLMSVEITVEALAIDTRARKKEKSINCVLH